jgi:hypothetical protein
MSEKKVMVITQELSRFQDAFTRGLEGITEAAQIFVAAIDDNPANAEKFREYFADSIPASAWSNFEAIGRKWMHPRLLLGGMSDRAKATLVKRLPYDEQSNIMEKRKRYPLLLLGGDTLEVSVQDATPEQVNQLIDGSTIRSLAAQKAFLEQAKTTKAIKESEPLPYTLSDGRITFRRSVTLTKAELRRILAEM